MAGAARYETVVTEVGEHVSEFLTEGVLVLFGEDAPEELREYSVIHRPAHADGDVEVGDEVTVAGNRMMVLAVGDVANDNLRNLGHLVLKRNGATEPALPGDVCCDTGPIPQPEPGQVIRVLPGPAGGGDPR